MNYFTSDMHFFHERLLGKNDFAPRLFANVDEMNQQLITSWNAVIKETELVKIISVVLPERAAIFSIVMRTTIWICPAKARAASPEKSVMTALCMVTIM